LGISKSSEFTKMGRVHSSGQSAFSMSGLVTCAAPQRCRRRMNERMLREQRHKIEGLFRPHTGPWCQSGLMTASRTKSPFAAAARGSASAKLWAAQTVVFAGARNVWALAQATTVDSKKAGPEFWPR